jgi:hypothetical protein
LIYKGAFNPDRPERSPDWVPTDGFQAEIKGTPFEHSSFYKQDSAYMNNAIFLCAFKYHFLPDVKHLLLKGRLLLLTDRYLAHIQLGVAQAAPDVGVDRITFAPHSTHIAQPLDVGLMSPLKTAYSNAVGRWRLGTEVQGNSFSSIRKALEILATPETGLTPWDREISEDNVKSAFARAGYPVSGSWVQIDCHAMLTLSLIFPRYF